MPEVGWLIVIVVIAALIFDFTNGWNDAANAVATVVSTRVLTPTQAVVMSALLNIGGAFFSVAVAKTIGKGIVDPHSVTLLTVLAALTGGIAWNTWMTLLGLPISASHALIGGLVGSALAHGGLGILKWGGLQTILLAMLVSPVLGGLLSFSLYKVLLRLLENASPSAVTWFFRKGQLVSVAWMSFSHGTNDAQKAMGIIAMALVAGGYQEQLVVPLWVIAACAIAMGVGTMTGGWRVIRTLGMRMLKLEPVHGFAAETGAAIFLTAVAHIGIPVSTTHTITGSILGVGAATRPGAVRWNIAGKIIYAWVFTLPGSALIAWVTYQIFRAAT